MKITSLLVWVIIVTLGLFGKTSDGTVFIVSAIFVVGLEIIEVIKEQNKDIK